MHVLWEYTQNDKVHNDRVTECCQTFTLLTKLTKLNFRPELQARGSAQPDPEETEEVQQLRQKVNGLRISLYRLARRLNQSPNATIIQQVIYRYSRLLPNP